MDFHISEKQISETSTLLTLTGMLNAASAPTLKTHIKKLIDANRIELILDISAVSFLDSSGLAVLVSGLKATRERGGWLKLAGANSQVVSIFKMTMLDRVFEMYSSVEEAQIQ